MKSDLPKLKQCVSLSPSIIKAAFSAGDGNVSKGLTILVEEALAARNPAQPPRSCERCANYKEQSNEQHP